jgi:catalase
LGAAWQPVPEEAPAQQQVLFENTARAIGGARLHIKQRHVAKCMRADPAYGVGVAKALGLDLKPRTIAAE